MDIVCVSIKLCITEKRLDGLEIKNPQMLFTSSRAKANHMSQLYYYLFLCIKWIISSVLIFNGSYPLFKCFEKQCIDNGWYFSLKEKYNYESQDNLNLFCSKTFYVTWLMLFVCLFFYFYFVSSFAYYMQFLNRCLFG